MSPGARRPMYFMHGILASLCVTVVWYCVVDAAPDHANPSLNADKKGNDALLGEEEESYSIHHGHHTKRRTCTESDPSPSSARPIPLLSSSHQCKPCMHRHICLTNC